MSLPITLAGRDFNTGTDLDGVRWTLDLPAGWWDGPQVDDELLPTIGEGSARGRVMVRHRTVIANGLAVASSTEAHDRAHLDIEGDGLAPFYSDTELVVHERTGPRYVMVHRSDAPQVRCHGRAIEFQLTLVATDPHKQSYEETP